jgi:thioredoxin 1
MMEPVIHELETELKDKVEIVKHNVDEEGQLASNMGVMGIPTYVVVKDGKEVGRKVGFTSKQDLLGIIKPHI